MDWKSIVRTVAPALAAALGSPIAGVATKFIADKVLGNPDASEQDIATALTAPSPDLLIKLKESDHDFALEMKRAEIDVFELETQDADSARNMQIETTKATGKRDRTPANLAYIAMAFLIATTFYFSINDWTEIEKYIWFNILGLNTFSFGYFLGNKKKENP